MNTGKIIALTRQTIVSRVMSLLFNMLSRLVMGFPKCSVGKDSAGNAGDQSSIPGLGRSTGEGIGYPFQYSWAGKESACNAGDPGSIPGSGRSTGEGIGYPLQ